MERKFYCGFCSKENYTTNKHKKYCDRNCKRKRYYINTRTQRLKYQKDWQKRRGNELYKLKYHSDREFKVNRNKHRTDANKIKISNKECLKCQSTKTLQRHHQYDDSIMILCQKCHLEIHVWMRKIAFNRKETSSLSG